MATIMSIFSRRSSANAPAKSTFNLAESGSTISDPGEASVNTKDLELFGSLGQDQQAIEFALGTVHQGLVEVEELVKHVSDLNSNVAKIFDDYRNLAVSNSAVVLERDRLQQRLSDQLEQYKSTHAELQSLQSEFQDVRRKYDRTQTELEALEHRHHLLGVAKREAQEQLDRQAGEIATADEELENLRIENSSLQEISEVYNLKISELNSKSNELNGKVLLLSNQCEALENSIQKKSDEILAADEKYDRISKEVSAAVLYGQQKEQEVAQLRAELDEVYSKSRSDKKARDSLVKELKSELDRVQPNLKMLEEVNSELVAENEKLEVDVRRLTELVKQSGNRAERLEASVQRMDAKIGAAVEAKVRIEESREAMGARLEAMTELLAEREAESKRLNELVDRLAAQVEDDSAKSLDTIEAMNSKIFELEKELSAQRNENTFYASQIEAIQRNPARKSPF